MKKKKITIIVLSLVLFLVAGAFVGLFGKQDMQKIKDTFQQEETVNLSNLIYNADFSINKDNVKEVTNETVSTYGKAILDGWYFTAFDAESYVAVPLSNGLYVKVVGETGHLSLQQHIYDAGAVIGQTVTMSFSVNNIVYTKTFTANVEGQYYSLGNDNGLLASMTRHIDGKVSFYLDFKNNFDGILNWVKLEKGSVFTGYSDGPSTFIDGI